MTADGARVVLRYTPEQLRECAGCGGWSHTLSEPARLCLLCRLGWGRCPDHNGRLEFVRSDHQRVTVRDVIAAIPEVVPMVRAVDG